MSGSSNDHRRRRLLLGAAGALAWPRARAAAAPDCGAHRPLPPRVRLEFDAEASRGPLTLAGDNEIEFSSEGGRYRLRSATRSVLFSAEQESHGELNDSALVPHEYRERSARRPARTTRIDWDSGRVRFSAAAEHEARAQPLLQDRLSLLFTLGLRLRAQGASAVELPVAGVRRIASYRFEHRGEHTVELPAGRFATHLLERPLSADDDGLEVWLAPALCWLPVWLRFTDDRRQVVQNRLRAAHFD